MNYFISYLFVFILVMSGCINSPFTAQAHTIPVKDEVDTQTNYTFLLNAFAEWLYPGEKIRVTVQQVAPFTTEKNDQPPDSLSMFITIFHNDKENKFVVLLEPKQGVFAYKAIDAVMQRPTPGEPEPQCSPEEHEQHHGKQGA